VKRVKKKNREENMDGKKEESGATRPSSLQENFCRQVISEPVLNFKGNNRKQKSNIPFWIGTLEQKANLASSSRYSLLVFTIRSLLCFLNPVFGAPKSKLMLRLRIPQMEENSRCSTLKWVWFALIHQGET
jgi:hypothetical protein